MRQNSTRVKSDFNERNYIFRAKRAKRILIVRKRFIPLWQYCDICGTVIDNLSGMLSAIWIGISSRARWSRLLDINGSWCALICPTQRRRYLALKNLARATGNSQKPAGTLKFIRPLIIVWRVDFVHRHDGTKAKSRHNDFFVHWNFFMLWKHRKLSYNLRQRLLCVR